jgi:2-methylcitrate dehydratase PrpD
MDVTARLASFSAGLSYNKLPPDVRELPRMFLLDTISVALGACDFFKRNDDRLLESYLASVAAPGPATVLGYGLKTTPTLAAFANGTLAETLDYQDSQMDVLTHNGTPIIPAVIAMSERVSAPWHDIATAIVAGYEVHTRLLRTIQPRHWYAGFQGLGTFGTCGAATAVGRLLGLDALHMKGALTVAGVIMPVSNSDNVFKAYTMKACIPAQAASCGISAAYLAQAGYEGVPLEGDPPEYNAPLRTLVDGEPNLELAVERLGEEWHCRRVCYKPYPIGHLIVGPVEIILEILKERRIDPAEVEKIDVVTYKHAVVRTGKYSSPKSTYIDAHFSIPFCVAVALTDGQLTPQQLWKERVKDPKVHELASRVVLTEDPEMSAVYPQKWPVKLTLQLRSGEKIARRLDEVKWSPERLPTWMELAEKFRMLADPLIGETRAVRAVDMIAGFKPNDTLKPLLSLLIAQTPRTRKSKSEVIKSRSKRKNKSKSGAVRKKAASAKGGGWRAKR